MPNRLVDESSPYLLQHANNPVQWYPWGPEALELASAEDKPIFLSIGYSACHWCHVMEHESFEDDAIARVLNENFVSIKVDREERPDLDQIYMNAVMALRNGQGGWPLSVFLTPEQEVFFGGTYWPPRSRMGMPGFDQVLLSVLDAYENRREAVVEQSKRITAWLNETTAPGDTSLDPNVLTDAALALERHFDFTHGGFGTAPKFPHTMDLSLLLRLAGRNQHPLPGNPPAASRMLEMVRLNLDAMALGGIHDHLGGGFARYSVDERWLVPHFEKMLYDNALLAGVYIDAYSQLGNPYYREVAAGTLTYVRNDLTDELGAFFSTEDADSEGVEGKFYVWSKEEIHAHLDKEFAPLFCELYNVTTRGNFEGENILNLTEPVEQFVRSRNLDLKSFRSQLDHARQTLLAVRDQRIRPGRDDKVLVSWNGLMIDSLARASVVLDEADYLDSATAAARFVMQHLRKDNGRLLHTWRHGTAKLDAYLDDYSFLINSLVSLYQASFEESWIDLAVELTDQMIEHFWDSAGGFFYTANDHEQLIARTKSYQDSSIPSGNAMAAVSLIRLGRLLGRPDWIELAEKTIQNGLDLVRRSPLASGQLLIALDLLMQPSRELVFLGDDNQESAALGRRIQTDFFQEASLICRTGQSPSSPWLTKALLGKQALDDQPTLYVCENFSCQQPVVGADNINRQLDELAEGPQP